MAVTIDSGKIAKVDRSGAVVSDKAVVNVPDTTASATEIGFIRFQKGFNLVGLQIESDDITSGTALTLDVGYVYDDTTLTSDTNAFLDGLDIGQDAGSSVWPVADGLLTGAGFEAEGDGWITVTTADAATNTPGDITVRAQFTYDE